MFSSGGMDAAPFLSHRVVEYLCRAEMKEPEIQYRDEYIQARIRVALAAKAFVTVCVF